jgi:prophage regulatory protein
MSDNFPFPMTGFVRLKSILGPKGPIPVSPSTWCQGAHVPRSGRLRKSAHCSSRWTMSSPVAMCNGDCYLIKGEDQFDLFGLQTMEARNG